MKLSIEIIEFLTNSTVSTSLSFTPKANNEALFHLFNLYQNEGGFILFTSEVPPARMKFKLPDLQSRLNIIPSISIGEPNDEMLSALVVKLFNDRQIMITPEILNYIIYNMERSFSAASFIVKRADELSLEKKNAVTIPLIRQVLSEEKG